MTNAHERRRARGATSLRARDAALPERRAAHRPSEDLLGRRRDRPLPPPARAPRAAPDGLRRVRPAGREPRDQDRRAPARLDGRIDRLLPAPVPLVGHLDRLVARDRDRTNRATTAGRSGSSSSCSAPASPTAKRRPSSGARTTRRCSPTSRSTPTGAASAAARSSRCASSSSGSCGSPTTPSGCWTTSTRSTGPSTSRRCSATGSGAREGAEVTFRCEELGDRLPGLHDAPGHAVRRDVLRDGARAPRRDCGWPRAPSTSRRCASTSTVALNESNEERGNAEKPKTGVPLGRTVTNPVNGEQIPMYVADYVLMEYGTGAIMAVPAHDERDYAFARAFELPIRRVIAPAGGDVEAEDDAALHRRRRARQLARGLRRHAQPRGARRDRALARREGKGHASVNYRLRDWLVSRQRYWGCPIPIVYCEQLRDRAGARRRAAGRAARRRGLRAEGPLAAGGGRGLGRTRRARRAAARRGARPTRWTPSSTPPGTSCATATPHNDAGRVGPGGAARVDAGRPVHRRRRARDPAPDVRALLHARRSPTSGTSTSRSRSRRCSRRGWSPRTARR